MTSPLRGPTARAVGVATAIIAAAALLLGLMAGALADDAPAADDAVPPAAVAAGTAPAPATAPPSIAPPAAPGLAASPPSTSAPSVPPAAAPRGPANTRPGQEPGRYVVAPGDTLAAIADRSGVPIELIAQDNGLSDPNRLAVGQVLTLSAPPRNVVVVVPGSSLGDYARQLSISVDELLALNPQIPDPDVIQAGAGLRVSAG